MGTIIPNYFGTTSRQDESAQKPGEYVIMENIFKDLNNGKDLCLCDIKIGDTPTPFERKKTTGSKEIDDVLGAGYKRVFVPNLDRFGFQLLGIKVKNSKTGEIEKYGKSLGRSTTALGVDYILSKFFLGCTENTTYRTDIIKDLVDDLLQIERWLKVQTRYKFRGSSLILAYIPETAVPSLPSVKRNSLGNPTPERPPPISIPVQVIEENSSKYSSNHSSPVINNEIPIAGMMPIAGALPEQANIPHSRLPHVQPPQPEFQSEGLTRDS